jgi:hypothetical protein
MSCYLGRNRETLVATRGQANQRKARFFRQNVIQTRLHKMHSKGLVKLTRLKGSHWDLIVQRYLADVVSKLKTATTWLDVDQS